jgi:hypothetical protein
MCDKTSLENFSKRRKVSNIIIVPVVFFVSFSLIPASAVEMQESTSTELANISSMQHQVPSFPS